MTREEMDMQWRKDGEDYGWRLPPPAHWLKRLPIIRNFRTAWNAFWIERHYSVGLGSIGLRSGYDSWVLYAIARGWC